MNVEHLHFHTKTFHPYNAFANPFTTTKATPFMLRASDHGRNEFPLGAQLRYLLLSSKPVSASLLSKSGDQPLAMPLMNGKGTGLYIIRS